MKKLGIIADDNTGATDAAGMCTEQGLRTLLLTQPPNPQEIETAKTFDAIIIGTQARSVTPQEAYRLTQEAVFLLQKMGVDRIQIKYCSTFDSTKKGNIGPSLDAACDALNVTSTIVCPALPVNGRITYQGYHFINGRLLSESPLKDHPLNPMTDSDLVRWLQYQTIRRVGLASLQEIRKGVQAFRAHLDTLQQEGMNYIVTDAIERDDLAVIADVVLDWPLISGGSGITSEIALIMEPKGSVPDWKTQATQTKKTTLVVSGSCSPTTLSQLEDAREAGFFVVPVDPRAVLDETFSSEETASELRQLFSLGQSVVLYASSSRSQIDEIQEYGRTLGLTTTETGERISEALAETARLVLLSDDIGRLVVSGGETSGAVCRVAGFRALEVGLPVDPGVPYCFPLDHRELLVVLKSGNFGARDFYRKVAAL